MVTFLFALGPTPRSPISIVRFDFLGLKTLSNWGLSVLRYLIARSYQKSGSLRSSYSWRMIIVFVCDMRPKLWVSTRAKGKTEITVEPYTQDLAYPFTPGFDLAVSICKQHALFSRQKWRLSIEKYSELPPGLTWASEQQALVFQRKWPRKNHRAIGLLDFLIFGIQKYLME